MKYAGVGARSTPQEILELMTGMAEYLADLGWTLCSGAADGADSAFEAGAGTKKEIFIPWQGYNDRTIMEKDSYTRIGATAITMAQAANFHPQWKESSQGVQKLHARNSAIVSGIDLESPVDMVICWTPEGKVTGGTGQALRVANFYDIPIFNLALEADYEKLETFVKEFNL